MGANYYTLTVKTSRKSATAFSISAKCDADAVGRALGVLEKLDLFFDRPAFEVVRSDGTILQGIARQVRHA